MASESSLHIGWVKDPEALNDINRARPNPDQHPVLVGQYDVSPKGGRRDNPDAPRTWCCHCQGRRHWHGYVLVDDDARHYLIGRHCGAKHYGADRFRAAKRSFDAIESARSQDRRLTAIGEVALAIADQIEELLKSPELVAMEEKRSEMETASPEALGRLVTSVRSGLSLITHEPVRGGTFSPVQLGQLEGGALISSDLRARCNGLLAAIADAGKLDDAANQTEKSNVLKRVDECLRETLKARNACGNAHRFFLKRNLVRLSRWSIPMRRFYAIYVDGKNLFIEDTSRGPSLIVPLPPLRLPALTACKQLLAAKH